MHHVRSRFCQVARRKSHRLNSLRSRFLPSRAFSTAWPRTRRARSSVNSQDPPLVTKTPDTQSGPSRPVSRYPVSRWWVTNVSLVFEMSDLPDFRPCQFSHLTGCLLHDGFTVQPAQSRRVAMVLSTHDGMPGGSFESRCLCADGTLQGAAKSPKRQPDRSGRSRRCNEGFHA